MSADMFLCGATRFKLSFSHMGNVNCLSSYKKELEGRWVALVPAENDTHIAIAAERDRLKAANADLAEALEGLTEIIENAGLQNLVHGVQLGRISWLVKATDCVTYARAALAQHDKEKS